MTDAATVVGAGCAEFVADAVGVSVCGYSSIALSRNQTVGLSPALARRMLGLFRFRRCRRRRGNRRSSSRRLGLLHCWRIRFLRAVRFRFLRRVCNRDRNHLILLHHCESVAGFYLEGIVLEAHDRAGDLRAVLQLDFVRARGAANSSASAARPDDGCDTPTHAIVYRLICSSGMRAHRSVVRSSRQTAARFVPKARNEAAATKVALVSALRAA